jgi:hypothetical protein
MGRIAHVIPPTHGADDIFNPRRAPRLRVCCPVRVTSGTRTWPAHTEDVGPRGCQLVSPTPLEVGADVQLVVSSTASADLSVPGEVVWATPHAPFRLGVAFAPRHAGATSRWFDDLVRAGAGPRADRYVPAIPADATVYLGAPPRFCPDFTPEEAAVVLAVGAGLRAGELRERFAATWSRTRHALFSLAARNLVTTSRTEAVPAARWRPFQEHLTALAAEWERLVAPAAPQPRPPDAQALYEDALVLVANGRVSSAIQALRAGLAIAPGDADIAAALFRVAWGRTGATPHGGG